MSQVSHRSSPRSTPRRREGHARRRRRGWPVARRNEGRGSCSRPTRNARLEQDAKLGLLLDLILPAVEALDRRDLRTGCKLALDQRACQPMRFLAAGDGRDHGDGLQLPGASARSAGTTTTCLRSLPAITESVVATPMRPAPSRRTRSSAPVTGSPSRASTMLPG